MLSLPCEHESKYINNKKHHEKPQANFCRTVYRNPQYQAFAQREDRLINQDWSFRFFHQVNANSARRVNLPHTWNAQDALSGKPDCERGVGNYTKKLFIHPEW